MNNSRLPNKLSKYFAIKDIKKILAYMCNDKKNNSSMINLILLKKIGLTIINKQFSKNSLNLFLKNELSN